MPIGPAGISTISNLANSTVNSARNVEASSPTRIQTRALASTSNTRRQTSSQTLETSLSQRINTSMVQEDVHLERIIVLDDAKNEYLTAIRRIDGILLGEVDKVNDSINAVNDAYQARVDSGCKTDLFWRLTDIEAKTSAAPGGEGQSQTTYSYTYECTRISPAGYPSVGDPPPPNAGIFGTVGVVASRGVNTGPSIGASVGVSTTTVEYVADDQGTHESVPLDSLFGFKPVNLYSLKMYDEPYTRDIGDTFVTSFIGTCGVGTNVVIAMTPNISGGISNIKPGQLLTCSKANVLNSDAYVITGVGTATANLVGINSASDPTTISEVVVPKIILDDTTVLPCFAPEDDGNYVTFTVLSDPDTLTNLGLDRDDSPYVPQRIKCPMTSSDRGKGVRVEFDNSGVSSGEASWNQFLEGQPDPNANVRGDSEGEIRRKLKEAIVKEPPLGGGRVFHKLGFDYAPVVYTSFDRKKYRLAKEGETVVLPNRMGAPAALGFGGLAGFNAFSNINGASAGVIKLSNCGGSVQNAIQTAQNASNGIISNFSSSTTENNIEVANMLRSDLMDINIRIWSERQLLGDAVERQGTYRSRLRKVNNNKKLIDGN